MQCSNQHFLQNCKRFVLEAMNVEILKLQILASLILERLPTWLRQWRVEGSEYDDPKLHSKQSLYSTEITYHLQEVTLSFSKCFTSMTGLWSQRLFQNMGIQVESAFNLFTRRALVETNGSLRFNYYAL